MGDCLATIDMGQKVGVGWGAGSPSNTMWSGPRHTSIPSGILIHSIVWPQYTDVTDRQRSDSIGRIVLETVAQKSCVEQLILSLPLICSGLIALYKSIFCFNEWLPKLGSLAKSRHKTQANTRRFTLIIQIHTTKSCKSFITTRTPTNQSPTNRLTSTAKHKYHAVVLLLSELSYIL